MRSAFPLTPLITVAVLSSTLVLTAFAALTDPSASRDIKPVRDSVEQRPVVTVARRRAPIVVDGRLDEAEWQVAPLVTDLVQSQPEEGAPATERTEIWMVYDDAAVYVAARMHDRSADSVMAYLVRRDRQNQSDLFGFYVDPFRDGQNGYHFIISAAGVQRDGTLFADNFADDTWDAVWDSAVERDAGGWSVELRIPYSQLRMRDGARQEWAVNFARAIGRRTEVSYLVPRLRQGAGFVSRFALLEGMDGVEARPRREFLPYVTQRMEVAPSSPGDPFFDGSRHRFGAGLDFRLGLGANLQLDGAVNPDFGQVEVDPAVVNLTDFEIFFQERRPFFVEGTNVFRFGQGGAIGQVSFDWPTVLPFYSRRIGRPPAGGLPGGTEHADVPGTVTILGASKLTGRLGEWNLGALGAVTGREQARVASGATRGRAEVEPLAGYGTIRAQRAFAGGRYGVGALGTLTQRDFDAPSLADQLNGNAVFAGLDGWAGLGDRRSWVLLGQLGGTRVTGSAAQMQRLQTSPSHYFQRPDAEHVSIDPSATSLTGAFGRVQLQRQRGAFMFHSGVGAISPGFDNNDLGFVARTDHVNSHVFTGWRWTQPTSWFNAAQIATGTFSSWDFGGAHTKLGIAPHGFIQFRNFSSVSFSSQLLGRTLDNRATRGGPLMVSPASASIAAGWGSDYRRDFSYDFQVSRSAVAGARGPGWSAEVGSEWRPSTSVNVRISGQLARNRTPAQPITSVADAMATATFGRRYVFGELDQYSTSATVRLDWTFSPRASFELFAQPLVSSVRYDAFRELRRPSSFDLLEYGREGSTYDAGTGEVDPDGAGPAASFSIGRPAFTFASLRGNAVFRWEYVRGSTLYLVWTQNRAAATPGGIFQPGTSFGELFEGAGNHVLLVKLSYWLSR